MLVWIENMIEKYDIDIDLRAISETRQMTKEELVCLFALYKTYQKYAFEIIFGAGRGAGGDALLKAKNGLWIKWMANERNGSRLLGIYVSCYDACISHLKNACFYECMSIENISQKAIEYFNQILKQEISDEEIIDFATNLRYIDELFFDDFVYMIRKIIGFETINDEETNKRIEIRMKNNEYFTPKFQSEFIDFVIYIGKKVGINYKEYDWKEMSYNEWVNDILLKAVDISKYPELVIKTLKKYEIYTGIKTLVRKKK